MSKIFQFAVILHPSEKEAEDGVASKVIVGLQTILATNANTALIRAGREIPEEYLDVLDRVEVAVRPF